MMKEEVIRKYVKDSEGLLREIDEWERTGRVLHDVYGEVSMYHDAVVFLFGRVYKYFSFEDIMFGSYKGLDAMVKFNDKYIEVEFEVFSREFKRDHLKDIKGDEEILIVCWENNWENPPSNIDIIELKHFWEITS